MTSTSECHATITSVLKDSSYNYNWNEAEKENTAQKETLDRTCGYAMAEFIQGLLADNNAPCVEEVIGLLEEFIQECNAENKEQLLVELSNALNNAG